MSASVTARVPARLFAWAGAALFAASLAYFLFTYTVTFDEIVDGPLRWRDVLTNVALFTLFALHHSAFARTPLRDWVARTVSPQLERSGYVWIASLMLIGVCAFWRPIAGVAWHVDGAAAWLPRVAMLSGVYLTLRSAAIIDVWELAGIRQASTANFQLPTPKEVDAKNTVPASESQELGVGRWEFRAEGPYALVRHPIYLGWFLIVFGAPTMTMTRLVFAVVSCVYVLLAIPLEERSLRTASGEQYARYMRQVRWKLFPGIY